MSNRNHILVVEDDEETRGLVCEYLEENGCRVSEAEDGQVMGQVLQEEDIDLIILDIMLPGEDGLSLCRKLSVERPTREIPVIMLTARGGEMDRVLGLEMGADDYLPKPFSPRELLARINSVLRRSRAMPRDRKALQEVTEIHFSGWIVHLKAQKLTSPDAVTIFLTKGEFALLMVFLKHPHQVLNRDRLMELYAQREGTALDRSIDAQVSRLRKRLREDPKVAKIIKTVWGKGYMLTTDVEEK